MRLILSATLMALALGLAACSDSGDEKKETAAPAETQQPATDKSAEKPAEQKPAATTETKPAMEQAKQSKPDTETVTNDACLAAVKKETGEPKVSVLSNEFSEANTLVMIGVGDTNAPWKCLVSNDGTVQEVSFTGDDSAGVQEPAASGAMANSSDVSDAAINACLAAVTKETSESDVATLSTEFSEANSMVMVGVGAQRAPWKCLVSNDGTVQEISFTGDEGKQ